jgi:hypothetical protein
MKPFAMANATLNFVFSELLCVIGCRIDAPTVFNLAEKCKAKLPLKPSTDSDDSKYFTHKSPYLEIAYSHNVRTRATYPPQKENRKYVCYVTDIRFRLDQISGLPEGINPTAALHAIAYLPGAVVHTHRNGNYWITLPVEGSAMPAQLRVWRDHETGQLDVDAHIKLINHDHLHYLRSESISHAFAPWHTRWPLEQTDLPMGMLMAWAIQRDLVGERHQNEHPDRLAAVHNRQMTGREFLYACAYANEVWSWDFSPRLHRFVHTYVHCLCHRNSAKFGRADRCGPEDDFIGVFGSHFANGGLDAADDWANFDRFARVLDARYRDWEITDLSTEISSEQAAQIAPIYSALAADLTALSAPIAHAATKPGRAPMPANSTAMLMNVLGRRTEDPLLQQVAEACAFNVPKATSYTKVEMPDAGLVLSFNREDSISDEHKAALDETDIKRLKSRKILNLVELEFIAAGTTIISRDAGNYVICGGYADKLPFALAFGDTLTDLDERLGPDELEYEEEDDEERITRRWRFSVKRPDARHPDEPETLILMLLVDFTRQKATRVRIVLK